MSVSWFALGMTVLEIEIEPVEEGMERDGETHTHRQTDTEGETQREKPRETQRTKCAHTQGRAAGGHAPLLPPPWAASAAQRSQPSPWASLQPTRTQPPTQAAPRSRHAGVLCPSSYVTLHRRRPGAHGFVLRGRPSTPGSDLWLAVPASLEGPPLTTNSCEV